MTFADTITSVLPPSCTITVPSGDEDLHSILSRWSDLGVKLPAAIVVPSTEDDISAVIKFALEHNLRVIPGNGGHGVFVPIDEKTIYLDMKKFNAVTVNKDEGLVTIGGGVSTGDVLRSCAAEGCYTRSSPYRILAYHPHYTPNSLCPQKHNA
jgi:FAD/FMN-containing dehydrogenase